VTTNLRDQLQAALGSGYIIERELGGGGMSSVFVVADTALQRRLVVKVLHPDLTAGISTERFRREIALAASLQHPHIVPLISAGEMDGTPFFTMPLVEGESLRAVLVRRGELPVDEAVHLLRDITLALAYAHQRGVIHRDIKPENILISGRSAVVTDFGVAKALTAAANSGERDTLTSSGIALGTPAYMAPEQAVADPGADERADLYSLGLVAYEMLTGTPPFHGRSGQQLLAAHAIQAPEPISGRRPGLPPSLSALVMRLLEKRPADRPQSAEAVLKELDGVAPIPATERRSAASVSAPRWLRDRKRGLPLALGLAGVVLLAFAAIAGRGLILSRSASRGAGGAAARSVAVMPFVNMSADRENEYFSDGMTEELINALANVEGLRVAARTSAFALKEKNLDVQTIGEKLHVRTVVEGSVRKAGNRLKITAQLIDATNGYHLWSDTYERDLNDVFAIQSEISRAIVGALRLKLAGAGSGTSLVARPTKDVAAYDLYLKGRYAWNQRTGASLEQATQFFEQAIARDPRFAQAYAGLADAYTLLPSYSDAAPGPVWLKARAAAEHALALDSTLAQARTSLAYGMMRFEWDFAGAEREFQHAIALDSTYATAHQWYADYLGGRGRWEDCLREMRIAERLDPLSLQIGTEVSWPLYAMHRNDEAIAQLKKVLQLDPAFLGAHVNLGRVYLQQRRFADALTEFEQTVTGRGRSSSDLAELVSAYAAAGQLEKARRGLAELDARAARGYIPPSVMALAHASMRDDTATSRWLTRVTLERDPGITELILTPMFDPVRSSPAYPLLLAKLGLEEKR